MKKLWVLLVFLGFSCHPPAWADGWGSPPGGYMPQPSQSFGQPPTIVRPVGPPGGSGVWQYGPQNGNPQGQINQMPNGGPAIIQPYSGGVPTICNTTADGSVICQ